MKFGTFVIVEGEYAENIDVKSLVGELGLTAIFIDSQTSNTLFNCVAVNYERSVNESIYSAVAALYCSFVD